MAFEKFLNWITGRDDGPTWREVSCRELFDAAADYTIRRLAFDVCVDMVASAIGRCDFRTFSGGKEIRAREYWLWNYEPNPNQNSTVFFHKLIDHLYRHNEALIISQTRRGGGEVVAVADEWDMSEQQILRENTYTNVRVEELKFAKTFRESDVIHLRLNQTAIHPVVDRLGESWSNMVRLAQQHYQWDRGQHWKVHVSQMAAGDDFEANFAKMIAEQVKPYLESDSAVLPEFDGWDYSMQGGSGSGDSRDIRQLAEDIFDFTARGFLIPAVLVNGNVEATDDANARFLTYVIDPICDQLGEEITRKRYGEEGFLRDGNFVRVDSSSIVHYDLFGQAASVEKLIGSGVYSINDILRAAGQAEIGEEWANRHFMTLNIEPIESAARELPQKGE